MKVAVTIWEDRISPVFDASRRVLIATIENARIIDREQMRFNPAQPSSLARILSERDVSVLICGAVSRVPAAVIATSGIKLIAFITGEVERVLAAYAMGASLAPTFVMPGCLDFSPETVPPSTK